MNNGESSSHRESEVEAVTTFCKKLIQQWNIERERIKKRLDVQIDKKVENVLYLDELIVKKRRRCELLKHYQVKMREYERLANSESNIIKKLEQEEDALIKLISRPMDDPRLDHVTNSKQSSIENCLKELYECYAECQICMDTKSGAEFRFLDQCSHRFCDRCVTRSTGKCMICRAHIGRVFRIIKEGELWAIRSELYIERPGTSTTADEDLSDVDAPVLDDQALIINDLRYMASDDENFDDAAIAES